MKSRALLETYLKKFLSENEQKKKLADFRTKFIQNIENLFNSVDKAL